jgi:hypothetical protein
MDNRDTLLSARLESSTADERIVELDLRDISALPLLGRHGQLQFATKLVFKAEDAYRQDRSMIELWADIRVNGQDGVPMPNPGRAILAEPVYFEPITGPSVVPMHVDPWTRSHDRLLLDLDHRQIDEIERRRNGGRLTFTFTIGGLIHHGGRVAALRPSNHTLTYDVSSSSWLEILAQLGYGAVVTIEVPLPAPGGLTGDVQQAAQALLEAQAAFRRGDYEEAVADCRPGLEALNDADKGKFNHKPWEQAAGKDERFFWIQRSLLSLTHVAHHPNDPVLAGDTAPGGSARWSRTDAETAMAILAALIRRRIDRDV